MRKALIVGIDDYPVGKLFGCVRDASSVATVLETHADGSPNFEIKLGLNIKTKSELKSSIVELFKGDSDISLLYFSGHGYADEYGAFLVTPDFKEYDEGLSMDEIQKIIKKSPAKEKIVILDSCYSGQFGNPGDKTNPVSEISTGTTILTACKSSEVAIEKDGQGVFTSLLISALQGGAASLTGAVTPGSLYAYIDQALGAWEQRPIFKTNITRFTSLRNAVPPIDISILRDLPNLFIKQETKFKLDPTYEYSEKNKNQENVDKFKKLQKLESVGLVKPEFTKLVDPKELGHMYWAAMRSEYCSLTALGAYYWDLAKQKKI
ncbi:MAG TPA: caspase family protein [Alphaproteobacteria bacterium]|nr:caspase family protein [Alphaproteobacteria bacterium]